jgi:hypothetical protein
MWMTRPGLSKPIPISPRQRMSGQASNGDIAATNYAGDYEAELAGTENIDGEECHVLNLTAKHKRATYDKIRYWVSVKRVVGIKAEFYSVSGKLLKTAHFEYGNTIEHEGKRIPFISRMTIRDALIDAETVMEFGTVKVKKIAASEFDWGRSIRSSVVWPVLRAGDARCSSACRRGGLANLMGRHLLRLCQQHEAARRQRAESLQPDRPVTAT